MRIPRLKSFGCFKISSDGYGDDLEAENRTDFFCPLENKSLAFSEGIFIFGKIEDLKSERQKERKMNCRGRIYPSR